MDQSNQPPEENLKGQAAPPPPPGCRLQWQYLQGAQPADGGAAYCTAENELRFDCEGGPPFSLHWADIAQVHDDGVTLTLAMADGGTLSLSRMGRLHDSFLEAVMDRWTKANRKQALSEETLLASFRGRAAANGRASAPCGIGVYRTAVVLDFADGSVTRLPLVFTGRPTLADWAFDFQLPGEGWTVSHLGRDTDAFRSVLDAAMGALEAQAQGRLRALSPNLPPLGQRALAGLLLDGRAVALGVARARHAPLAQALVQSLSQNGLQDAWTALAPLGAAEDARIGEKAGLQSGGVYRFFLLPVLRGERAAVIFEASSEGDTGRATYVFRVEGGPAMVQQAMDALNYALVCVNFRREPIYLSEEQLRRPQYEHYARSVERVPALAGLRRSYIGRAAHSTPEAWLSAVKGLLDKMQ